MRTKKRSTVEKQKLELTTHPPLAWSPFPHKGRLTDAILLAVD